MADVIDTNQGGGTLYPFKSYLNALSWTMDGTYKLYPSKYILLSGTQEDIVSECDGNFDSSNSEVVEEYTKQRLLPFCFKDGKIQYVTTTDSDGNEVETDELNPQIEDPNNPDGKYIQQKLGYVGNIVCGGDINFLNHDSGQFETIVYASQSDQQSCTYLTKFSLDEPDISDTIFVDVTGVENPNYPDKISFDGVLIFYNVYRKVGEFVDDLTDVYMADLPMAIYKLDTGVSLESNEEWLTRICMTFDSNSENSLEITTLSDNGVVAVANKLNDLITLAEEIDAQDAQYYTDLDEVRSYYNEFKNNRHVNVPYIQGNWWFVNGKKAGLYQMGDIVKDSIDEVRGDLDALEGWLGYDKDTVGAFPGGDDPDSFYSWVEEIAKELTKIKETTANESDLEELETWVGYGGDVGDYGSLFNWVFDLDSKITSTVSDISDLDIKGDDYISVDHTGNVFSLTFNADEIMDTLGENYLTVSNAENLYQRKISVTSPLTMTGTVISIDLSNYLQKGSLDGYVTGADLADYVKLSYLEDNYYTKSEVNAYYLTQTEAKSTYLSKTDAASTYQEKISVTTHSSWQRLTLSGNTLDFTPGHLGQTYISASSVTDQDLTYVYDENNPCYDNTIYNNCSYGISPLPADSAHEPTYTSGNRNVIDNDGNRLRNCITSQIQISCNNNLYSSYSDDDVMMEHTQYQHNPGTGLMLLSRDNTFKNYIPRAYVNIHPDLIDFLVDTHSEENVTDNVHPENPDWNRYTGDDKDEIQSYYKRIWLDRAGFHMGGTQFGWTDSDGDSWLYISNSRSNNYGIELSQLLRVNNKTTLNDTLTVNADASISGELTVNTIYAGDPTVNKLNINAVIDTPYTLTASSLHIGSDSAQNIILNSNGIHIMESGSYISFVNSDGGVGNLTYGVDGNLYLGSKKILLES